MNQYSTSKKPLTPEQESLLTLSRAWQAFVGRIIFDLELQKSEGTTVETQQHILVQTTADDKLTADVPVEVPAKSMSKKDILAVGGIASEPIPIPKPTRKPRAKKEVVEPQPKVASTEQIEFGLLFIRSLKEQHDDVQEHLDALAEWMQPIVIAAASNTTPCSEEFHDIPEELLLPKGMILRVKTPRCELPKLKPFVS